MKFIAFVNMFWRAIGRCIVHDLLQCMFFTALGTLITSSGELHSNEELGRLGNWSCDDALIFALKPMYMKGQLDKQLHAFGIKLPGHIVTACTLSSNDKFKLSKSLLLHF